MKSKIVLAVGTVCVVFASLSQAAQLPSPTGRVILTVSGNITNTNTANNTAEFDRQMLQGLDLATLDTTTPWTEGINSYKGPLLKSILDYVGAKSSSLSVTALNDYSASVPVKDAYDYDTILAMSVNGKTMGVREKGPLFLLYPFSQNPSLNNEVIHNRSVWQIKAIKVE